MPGCEGFAEHGLGSKPKAVFKRGMGPFPGASKAADHSSKYPDQIPKILDVSTQPSLASDGH
ncbi:MAG: hypothetical protein D6690_00835 [Nitrospirae bacterium]|nr:MAG: hypothetical protein D6690_00835 [Nitrospirota bacterium]